MKTLENVPAWVFELTFPVTVCDKEGILVYMNEASIRQFSDYGGDQLLGQNLLDCHPGDSRAKVEALLQSGASNTYTIEKHGVKKLIHQSPWFENGVFGGLIEIAIPLPEGMPHFVRA
jgi:DUF438 domain-containing protein